MYICPCHSLTLSQLKAELGAQGCLGSLAGRWPCPTEPLGGRSPAPAVEEEAAGESSQAPGGSSASGCRGTGTAGGSAGGSRVQGANGGRTWQIGGQEERRSVESNCDRLCPALQDLCLLLPLGEFAVEHRTEPKGLARLPGSRLQRSGGAHGWQQ